jgi:hypothetical protein
LDQLVADATARVKSGSSNLIKEPERLNFNIDDYVGPLERSCSRFKNKEFVSGRLERPARNKS